MKVVRHDYKCIQFQIWKSFGQPDPFLLHDIAPGAQAGFTVDNFTKCALPPTRDNGDEIHTRLRVIVILQADGTAVVFVRIAAGHRVIGSQVSAFGALSMDAVLICA